MVHVFPMACLSLAMILQTLQFSAAIAPPPEKHVAAETPSSQPQGEEAELGTPSGGDSTATLSSGPKEEEIELRNPLEGDSTETPSSRLEKDETEVRTPPGGDSTETLSSGPKEEEAELRNPPEEDSTYPQKEDSTDAPKEDSTDPQKEDSTAPLSPMPQEEEAELRNPPEEDSTNSPKEDSTAPLSPPPQEEEAELRTPPEEDSTNSPKEDSTAPLSPPPQEEEAELRNPPEEDSTNSPKEDSTAPLSPLLQEEEAELRNPRGGDWRLALTHTNLSRTPSREFRQSLSRNHRRSRRDTDCWIEPNEKAVLCTYTADEFLAGTDDWVMVKLYGPICSTPKGYDYYTLNNLWVNDFKRGARDCFELKIPDVGNYMTRIRLKMFRYFSEPYWYLNKMTVEYKGQCHEFDYYGEIEDEEYHYIERSGGCESKDAASDLRATMTSAVCIAVIIIFCSL